MGNNRLKSKLYKNAVITLLAQIIRMFLQFVLQRVFIKHLGITYLGYNSVFKNILQMLNMADLGVGVAITSFLYKPLAENNIEHVRALMQIYKKVYHAIGFIVIGIGAIILLFLPVIIPDADCSYSYLRILFCINVVSTLSSYFLAYKRTLLVANQMSYYTSAVDLVMEFGMTLIQIFLLVFVPDYLIYLVLSVAKNVFGNVVISIYSNRNFGELLGDADSAIVEEYKKPILNYVKDIFASKIGAYIYNGTDNIIISIFKGSILTGYLSNYALITTGLKSIITQMLSAVQATFGIYVVTETDKSKKLNMTDNYLYLDYLIGSACTICCILLYQPFISICFGQAYLLDISTVVLISVNLGLSILLIIPAQVFVIFKLYKYDKFIICISAAFNITVSVALVRWIGINGVLIGTTITSLIYLFSRLYIMSKKIFEVGFSHYMKKIIVYIFVSGFVFCVLYLLHRQIEIDGVGDFALSAISYLIFSVTLPWGMTFFMKERIFVKKEIVPVKGRKYRLILVLVILVGITTYMAVFIRKNSGRGYNDLEFIRAEQIRADESIKLPDIGNAGEGFTCTGLSYDQADDVFYVGRYGKVYSDDEYSESEIIVLDSDFGLMRIIELTQIPELENSIQGIAYDSKSDTIWFTDTQDIIEIDKNGNFLNRIAVEYKKPNGLAYNSNTDSLWVLCQKQYLLNITKKGEILTKYKCDYDDQDQLCFDEDGNLYITVGADYAGLDNFVLVADIETGTITAKWRVMDSYAIEGIVIKDDTVYIANDGLYHEAAIQENIIQKYIIKTE